MKKVRLEIDFIEIKRKRRKWNLYMIIATDDPSDDSKTMITTVPGEAIKLRKMDGNRVDFESEGSGQTNGLIVLERNLPSSHSLRVRIWLVQSRKNTRKAGEVLEELGSTMKKKDMDVVFMETAKALGSVNPWIEISRNLIMMSGMVGTFLRNSDDRHLGFFNLDEHFTEEEIDLGELDRFGKITSVGEAGWTWVIEDSSVSKGYLADGKMQ